ncbi:MAG TPA: chemotaxis protein CheW [Vicinamibacterales bacterium]|nr:chemotaxis protein CheW [Vicinamibacterales bacterium]
MSDAVTATTLVDAVAAADASLDGAIAAADASRRGSAAVVAGDRYVLLSLAATTYAVLEAYVTEIDRVPRITPVPHVPAWVRGVTSVRGDILSVVDLRAFLGLDAWTTAGARMLVVRLLTDEFAAGLLVDGVDRIVEIAAGAIGAPESPLDGPLAPYLNGICTVGDRTVAVLDLDRLLRSPEIRQFEERHDDAAEAEGQGTTSCEER